MNITFTEVYFYLDADRDAVCCFSEKGVLLCSVNYREAANKQQNIILSVSDQFPNSGKTVACRIITNEHLQEITIGGRYYIKFSIRHGYLSDVSSGAVK